MAKRGRPFEAGNKPGRGRPPGSRNLKTLLIEELLDENSESLLHKVLRFFADGAAKKWPFGPPAVSVQQSAISHLVAGIAVSA
jgi:hypothetical protein